MITLNSLFDKPVDRSIEGVIKADDDASVLLEIQEYVLTNEIEQRLGSFLEAYNNYKGSNGVWVSGFFGSGKSHLLKMLAVLLENRQFDGNATIDLFLPKCNDKFLCGELQRAVSFPSRSILFNIDQKADVITKSQQDALLSVFAKVFDEMCGYYGKQGYIAQFERDLDNQGIYEKFKNVYQGIAGKTWEKGREEVILEGKNIDKAFASITEGDDISSKDVLKKYREQYKLSIEDFAYQVKTYIEKQPANFRLNFFIDEVGQYIADNIKLMTNLQTIAESLATKCQGRAWIIVTAQEDMVTVVGEMGKQQSNDFSKIQARFANRMKLTSSDVAEVIQKRLLQKKKNSIKPLTTIYRDQANNFRTLFNFADGSQSYQNFQNEEHFIWCYPFIPYQFTLFQSAIQCLSQHNAFEGKHSSVGERSMLGVFQQVVINISSQEVGKIATFDQMYEGIRTALKSNIQRAIFLAEKHLSNPFAIRLLKALFLVKYIKEFKPIITNLRILMQESFSQNPQKLNKEIEEALALLEQQTYIQRNGQHYHYLTDEEKDVEQEIKNTEVDTRDVTAVLENIIFDQLINQKKIRYQNNEKKNNGVDYPFTRKLDGLIRGRSHDLAIHVITPFYENAEKEEVLISDSMGLDELLVILPSDKRLMDDILMYNRTEKYIKQNTSLTQKESLKRIISDKAIQNRERHDEIQNCLKNLLVKAKLFVKGRELEVRSEDIKNRVITGFHELVARVFINLRMLRGIDYTENDVATYLETYRENLLSTDESWSSEEEQEMFAFIMSNQKGMRITLQRLFERFERKPYGWPYPAVLCILAKLCGKNKIEVRYDGNLIEGASLEKILCNNRIHEHVILDTQIEFKASEVRACKDIYEGFFDTPPGTIEAKELGKQFSQKLNELIHDLEILESEKSAYPFLKGLDPVLIELKKISDKSYDWYLQKLQMHKDSLLQMKEAVIDPIRNFMNGSQREIYDSANKFLENQKTNLPYINGEEIAEIDLLLQNDECHKSNQMNDLKKLIQSLRDKLDELRRDEIAKANVKVEKLKNRFCETPEFNNLNDEQKKKAIEPFETFVKSIEHEKLIPVIRANLQQFEETEFQNLISLLTLWSQPKTNQSNGKHEANIRGKQGKSATMEINARQKEIIPWKTIQVRIAYNKLWLDDESDLEHYLKSLKEALLLEIRQGKRIGI